MTTGSDDDGSGARWTLTSSGIYVPAVDHRERSRRARWLSRLRSSDWTAATQAIGAATAALVSVLALLFSLFGIWLQMRQTDVATRQFSERSASLVTVWEVVGEEAAAQIPGSTRVTRIQNKSADRIEYFIIEREDTTKYRGYPEDRYFTFHGIPPCTVFSFQTPFDEQRAEWWVWDDTFFAMGRILWTRRNDGYLKVTSEKTEGMLDENADERLQKDLDQGRLKSRTDHPDNC